MVIFDLRYEIEQIKQKLHSLLEKRKQLDEEHIIAFINETDSQYKRLNYKMFQDKIVRYIMKSLKINIYVGIMDNLTIK